MSKVVGNVWLSTSYCQCGKWVEMYHLNLLARKILTSGKNGATTVTTGDFRGKAHLSPSLETICEPSRGTGDQVASHVPRAAEDNVHVCAFPTIADAADSQACPAPRSTPPRAARVWFRGEWSSQKFTSHFTWIGFLVDPTLIHRGAFLAPVFLPSESSQSRKIFANGSDLLCCGQFPGATG